MSRLPGSRAAEVVAGREWARLGARSEAEARAFFTQSYRRRLGVSVVREFARHRYCNRSRELGRRPAPQMVP